MLLYQPNGGYCFNSDSILLYGFISHFNPKGRVLDIGAGSGIIGLLLARDFPEIVIEAVEKQAIYATFAKKNAQINNISYTLHEQDLFEMQKHGSYDWIVSNPPFYSEGMDRSENPLLNNARYNIHMPIEQFALKISKLLKSNGQAALCYDARQFSKWCSALQSVGLTLVHVQFIHSKITKESTVVMMHIKKNSRALMKILPPFVLYSDEKHYGKEAQHIYSKAKVHSIKCPIS